MRGSACCPSIAALVSLALAFPAAAQGDRAANGAPAFEAPLRDPFVGAPPPPGLPPGPGRFRPEAPAAGLPGVEDLLRRLQPGDAPPRPSFIRDLIGVRAPDNIRDNPRVAEDLRRFERPSGFEQLKRQFLGDDYSRLEWPPGSIPPLGVADNPIFMPEVWARLSGLAPFLMPAGPEDSTEVLGPAPGRRAGIAPPKRAGAQALGAARAAFRA